MKESFTTSRRFQDLVILAAIAGSSQLSAQTTMASGGNSANEWKCPPGQTCPVCEDERPIGVVSDMPKGANARSGLSGPDLPPVGNVPMKPVPWNGLRVRYAAKWWVLPGGNVGYCVEPSVEFKGTVAWTTPLVLSLVDGRLDEVVNEDLSSPGFPFGYKIGPAQIPRVPHTKAQFAPRSAVGAPPYVVGSKVGTSPVDWCVQSVPWVSRPSLEIQVAGRSCPVVFPDKPTTAGSPKTRSVQ